MEFISENKISEELVNSFDEEMTFELAKRLAVSYTPLRAHETS